PQAEKEVQKIAQELKKSRGDILERLADHYYITGDLQSAELFIHQALKENNTSDYLHYLQMQLLIERGETSQAREYYRNVTKVMLAHGQVGPAPNLRALYQEIRKDIAVNIPEPQPTWDIHPGMEMPLVGRENILSQLHLSRKQQQSVLLLGEVGQGKTRVLKEYADNVSSQTNIFYVTCKPNEVNLSYQPFISLFRHQITPDKWLELSPVWASPLSRMLPEIAMIQPNVEEIYATEDNQRENLLTEAIRQVFKLLASERSLLLIFDDIQHADRATLQTITYLIERYPFKNGRGMLVGTARENELMSKYPELVSSLHDSKNINFLKLQKLSSNDISKLAYHVLQESPSIQLTRTLSKESNGNPLFIAEILWTILDTDIKLDINSETDLPISKKLSKIIETRLMELDEETYRILEAASILGPSFDISLLPLMAKMEEEETYRDFKKAVKKNIVTEQKENQSDSNKYHFVQQKFREVLLRNMNSARCALLHNQAARIKVDEDAEPAIIAAHYEKAGIFEAAFHYWVKAGEKARCLASSTEVVYAFQHAEELLITHKLSPSNERIHLFFTTWSAIASETKDIELLQRLNQSLLEIGEKRTDNLLIGTAWGNLSDVYIVTSEYEEGLTLIDRALTYLDETRHTTEYIENLVRRGTFLYMLNRLGQAEEVFQDALTLGLGSAKEPKVFSALANAHFQMAVTNILNAHPQMGLKHAKLCLERAKESNHPHRQLAGHAMIAFSQYYLGEYKEARIASDSGFKIADRIHGWRILGYLHTYRAMTELAEGNISAAFEHADQTIQIGQKFSYQDNIALGKRITGDIYCLLQAYNVAHEHYSAGYEAATEHFTGFDNHFRLGFVLAQEGKIAKGQQLIEDSIEIMNAASITTGTAMAMLAWETTSLKENALERAMRLNTKIRKIADGSGWVSLLLSNQILSGKIALKVGNVTQAEEYFQLAAQKAAEISNPWIEIEAQRGLEETHQATDQENGEPRERITQLLDNIKEGITHQHLLPHYTSFRERIFAQNADPVLHY
ncbi:MAG: AAA family ATPase, partial [Chloroflexota bacterium]|nr:AAA family ATPase [Chloroflexota bacterium]